MRPPWAGKNLARLAPKISCRVWCFEGDAVRLSDATRHYEYPRPINDLANLFVHKRITVGDLARIVELALDGRDRLMNQSVTDLVGAGEQR